MLALYVLFACVHFTAKNPAPRAGQTRCVEKRVFFDPAQCKRELPEGGGLTEKTRYERSWIECKETRADSWIPADADARASRLYQAQASASDANAMAALLAPLSTRARAALGPGDFKRHFQRAFRGPGRLSFFVVGTGASVIVFAVTNLDDFQFAQMSADVSSSSEGMTEGVTGGIPEEKEELDFATIAENAGVKLGYHTQMSRRATPPPGGMETDP
jgi:hypothetical protein